MTTSQQSLRAVADAPFRRIVHSRSLPWGLLALVTIAAAGCGNGHPPQSDNPIGKVITITAPLGLPPIPVPADDPETVEGVGLGRRLFYERRLSAGNAVSCASCHNPLLCFTDGLRHSTGSQGRTGTRNAPTVMNAAYFPYQFWDGRAASLEDQAGGPMTNPVEMNQSHDISVSKLNADSEYREAFEKAYGPGRITINRVEKAIASFERTLISGDSPFDRYQFGGDNTALSPAAIRGLAIFRDPAKGDCAACHTISQNYALFTDGKFHNIGVAVDGSGDLLDQGRYSETKVDADRGAFKTPTLRNVALTAPYMHDGSLKTLRDVVDFYAGGGNSNPYLDSKIKEIKLSGQDRTDLVEFLKSLTGTMPADAGTPDGRRTEQSE